MSHFDESYSQVFFGYNSGDSESSFIGDKPIIREISEDSSVLFHTKKRRSARVPNMSRHITCFENDFGGSIEMFSYSQYLQLVKTKQQLIDCNIILLLFTYLSKGTYKIFTQFLLDILPHLDEFSLIVLTEYISTEYPFKSYLKDTVNLTPLFKQSLEMKSRALLQFYLEIKPLPDEDLTPVLSSLLKELHDSPTEQTYSFTSFLIERMIGLGLLSDNIVYDYVIVLLKLYLSSSKLLPGVIQSLLLLSESKMKQQFLDVLNHYRLSQQLTLDQQHFLSFFFEGEQSNDYQYDNIVYHIDLSFIISKIESLYISQKSNHYVLIKADNQLPLSISQMLNIIQFLSNELHSNPLNSLHSLKIVLSNLLNLTHPLSPDFLHSDKLISILFDIIPILCSFRPDTFSLIYSIKEVLYYDLILLVNLSSSFPCLQINANQLLLEHFPLLKDNLITCSLCFCCFSCFNYYNPIYTDDTLTSILEYCVELFFENDEFQIDAFITQTEFNKFIPLTSKILPFTSQVTTPFLHCIEHSFICFSSLKIFLNFLKKCQILYDEIAERGSVKRRDLINYIKQHNPLLCLEIIIGYLESSTIIMEKLYSKRERLQYCGLVNNAIQLANKMLELISLKFTNNTQFISEVERIRNKLLNVTENNDLIKKFINSNYFKLIIPEEEPKIDLIEKMKGELNKNENK
ncbi:hypothetical protein EHI8A_032010 [Entamoeba histolytica HM-1:IMSS-B]|uniref:Uncharacterized protein n=4 Tax=Entamoeba histolytica TaxID=5759 RepID=B1N482_ENTH1|nr:hypothetical protein EHI_019120 [Entamoeba histolytica HM-1:IMSS]EDS89226.1 hypothetical protein EHI_019120 [Entamoeba histolytica HM-1:IMSS]EMH74712.1 hypothetical protein EHI8A_032010 [Entamoeba histolytica HM-1:IMSS-B]ENY60908.1 hypothetical protein EHI7A_021730 [Entamoeba histolytica HM-1:IMSS-A]GAT97806.1 hypothetical protein CL6EHI_019120 [Entamoeba histolytica]|eukprot:XP_001913999.1 hypothetical protein EHI_019120 [Entamoeba histolytica HM-1:IMSS]